MADDPRPIEGKPTITVEFDGLNSSIANFLAHHVNYMQLFAAAKLLEMQGETMFMEEQIRAAERKQRSGKGLFVPEPGSIAARKPS